MLVIRRIRVTYRLAVEAGVDRAAVDRAFTSHTRHCPVYRSLHPQIEIRVALDLVEA